MSALLDLAERCEKAGASEQRDWLTHAFVAVHGEKPPRIQGGSPELSAWLRLYNPFYQMLTVGAFLDAALTLVPEGAFWWVGMRGEHRGGFHACCQIQGDLDWREGATPALALCAAALRALAASDASPPASASHARASEAGAGMGAGG